MRLTFILLPLIVSFCVQGQSVPDKSKKIDENKNISFKTLFEFGFQEFNKGNYPKAIEWFEKTVNQGIVELGKEHPDYAASLSYLTTSYYTLGLYAKAEPLFIEIIYIYEKAVGKEHPFYASSLNNLAALYLVQGLFAKAEPLYIEAKKINEKTKGKEHTEYALSLNNLAVLYIKQGLYAKAEPLFIEVIQINEKALGKGHNNYALNLNNLADLYFKQGLYTKAEPLYIEAKHIVEKALGKEHLNYALILNSLAVLYNEQGLYAKAEPLFIEAIQINEKVLGKEHLNYAGSLNTLANSYSIQGEYTKAEPLYLQAKNIREKALGKDNPDYANSLNNIGCLYDNQGLYAKAEPFYAEANNILLHQIEDNFSQLSEKEKGLYFKTFSYDFERFHSFMLKRMKENPEIINEGYKVVLGTKGLLFDGQQKIKNRILNSKDSVLITLYDSWQGQLSYLSMLYEKTIKQRENIGVDIQQEEEKANKLEKQISSKSELFALASEKTKYNWQDVQQSLEESEAAIEIIRIKYYEKKMTDSVLYVAMIVTPRTKNNPEVVVMGNGNELEGKHLKSYKNSIKFKIGDKQSYPRYWRKINQALEGVERVYLSQNGVYHSLSLGGLLNPETGGYLADEIEIRLVSSTKDLATDKRKKNPAREMKLVGFPSYNAMDINSPNHDEDEHRSLTRAISTDTLTRFFDGSDIAPLAGTKTEVNNISQIMKTSGLLVSLDMGEEASEANVKSWNNPMIAHIATHGYFLKDEDIKHDNDRIGGISKEALVENPLLRSGLLLYNAKNAIQNGGDGVLTAYEAKSLDLDETELVVLSACETGLGEVKNGEGVYGLQRAFQTAGAATVLMSLWTVNDKATQELMTNFYQNWLFKKQTKREAFKNAQKSLREQFPEPYYWSAFVMVGE